MLTTCAIWPLAIRVDLGRAFGLGFESRELLSRLLALIADSFEPLAESDWFLPVRRELPLFGLLLANTTGFLVTSTLLPFGLGLFGADWLGAEAEAAPEVEADVSLSLDLVFLPLDCCCCCCCWFALLISLLMRPATKASSLGDSESADALAAPIALAAPSTSVVLLDGVVSSRELESAVVELTPSPAPEEADVWLVSSTSLLSGVDAARVLEACDVSAAADEAVVAAPLSCCCGFAVVVSAPELEPGSLVSVSTTSDSGSWVSLSELAVVLDDSGFALVDELGDSVVEPEGKPVSAPAEASLVDAVLLVEGVELTASGNPRLFEVASTPPLVAAPLVEFGSKLDF